MRDGRREPQRAAYYVASDASVTDGTAGVGQDQDQAGKGHREGRSVPEFRRVALCDTDFQTPTRP